MRQYNGVRNRRELRKSLILRFTPRKESGSRRQPAAPHAAPRTLAEL
ncbi:unnamed protein product [Plutella xylostella]|uniref:(diamondback moth) hypothetical protein n=1 Tax=Plutella xylostella TaxID=51655 RepID=A0A8S4FZ93_PLUXY|nr:unnamed protein product [Plutella xylostella]